MIPPNPIEALAKGDFLSIITFSILVGLFIIRVGGESGKTLANFFQAAFDVMMEMTLFIIRLAPIGVFAFILFATASQGLEVFKTFGLYMLTVFLALMVHACVVLPLILYFVAKQSPWKYFKALSPALMTAFSTASSNGTLPLTLTSVEERAGISNRISSFVLPLGATINMDGTALYEAVAVLFIAQAYNGFVMPVEQQIVVAVTALLASVGAAGIPSAGLVMMAIVLQAVGLPLDAQGLIIAVDRVLDMSRTAVNVWSDSCGCAVLARFDSTPEQPPPASVPYPLHHKPKPTACGRIRRQARRLGLNTSSQRLRRPNCGGRAGCFLARFADGFHAKVRGDETAAMLEMAHGSRRIGPAGFDQVFNHKPRPAQAAHQLFPAVQIFHRAGFAVGGVFAARQRAFVIILAADDVLMPVRAVRDLQARRCFVLADVKAAVLQHPRDFPIDGFHIRHVAGADRLMHQIEHRLVQHRQIVHRGFDGADGKLSAVGFAGIQPQHAPD